MSAYLDTSVLVSALTAEASTARVQAWLRMQPVDGLVVSGWVATEFSSAPGAEAADRPVDGCPSRRSARRFHRLLSDSLTTVAVTPLHFRLAAAYVDRDDVALRAGDALHLAVAADHGVTLHTLDRRLREACLTIGVASALV